MSTITLRIAAALALAVAAAGCEPQPKLTEGLADLPGAVAPADDSDDEADEADTTDQDGDGAADPRATEQAAAEADLADEGAPAPRWTSALDNLGFDESGQRPGRGGDGAQPRGGITTIIIVPPAGTAAPAAPPTGFVLGGVLDDGTGTAATATVNPGTANDPGVPPTAGTPRGAAMPRYPTRGPTGAIGSPGSSVGVGRSGAGTGTTGTTVTTGTGTGTVTTTGGGTTGR